MRVILTTVVYIETMAVSIPNNIPIENLKRIYFNNKKYIPYYKIIIFYKNNLFSTKIKNIHEVIISEQMYNSTDTHMLLHNMITSKHEFEIFGPQSILYKLKLML